MGSAFAVKLQELERRLLDRPGTLDPAVRRVIGTGGDPPAPLASYVEKVRLHAYKVTDQDIADLRAAGYSEDQIFELTVATAYGAARLRLDRGRAAADGGASEPAAGTAEGSAS
jgi:alkylhydroperoxidase family enzyme